ncbi:MAG TPA: sulfite exporter TauE/SafE family protein [Methylomirabilota bacterium]|nr:sulfite exporter TauE/SafE family protein [Methylomirabilota bacterium]
MTPTLEIALFALAFCGAFVSGLVGVGGAIVMIPLLYYVPPLLGAGELPITAVAGLSMTQVLAAAAVGTWSHGRHAMVHRRLALTGGPAMAGGSLLGAVLSSHVSGRALLATFAIMTTIALPLMFISPADPPGGDDRAPVQFSPGTAIAVCGVVGLVAGLVGAGGAFLLVPVLVGVMRVPMRLTIGTSLAMVGLSALTGFLGKALTGQVPLWPAVTVVLGSLTGAPLGSRVSRRVPVPVLRGVLAGIIALVMVRVWYDVIAH